MTAIYIPPPASSGGGGPGPASDLAAVVLSSAYNAAPAHPEGPPRVAIYGDLVLLFGVLEVVAPPALVQFTDAPLPAKYRPSERRGFSVPYRSRVGGGGDNARTNGLVVRADGHMEVDWPLDAYDPIVLDGLVWRAAAAG